MTSLDRLGVPEAAAPLPSAPGTPDDVPPPREPSDLPALRRLVAAEPSVFADQVWGREALLSRAADLAVARDELFSYDLFSEDAVDELVSRRGLRTPFVRVARDGTTLGDRAFTSGGGVGAAIGDQVSDDRLLQLFAEGATIVLQGLHRVWPPLTDFAQQLAGELAHPVQVNAYVTPPQSRGFDDHYDVHDVFVLQVAGEKRWRVHEPVHEAPLRDQPWTSHRSAVEAAAATQPLIDTVLRPGDCLYLPRGYLHAAEALGGVSTHLTFGVHTWTRYHLAGELVRAALHALADDPEIRRSLPFGAHVGDAEDVAGDVELVRRRLTQSLETVAADVVAAHLAERSRDASRAAPVAPLAQLRLAAALDAPPRPGTPSPRLRAHLHAEVQDDGGRRVLRSRAGDLELAEADVPGVERLLAAADTAPATVADVLTDLDRDLVRRLVLAGVLVPE